MKSKNHPFSPMQYNANVRSPKLFVKQIFIVLLLALSIQSAMSQENIKNSKKELSDERLVKSLPGFKNGFSNVNGFKIHYVAGGQGKPLVLLPGWPQTWWSFHKIMPELAKKYYVIAIDIRGMGASDKPQSGYDKKTMAKDVSELLHSLGIEKAHIAGHDIGAQVAFSVVANYPNLTEKLIIMDVPHPDDSFASSLLLPAVGTPTDKLDPARPYLWWFAFNQVNDMPEEILLGRVATFQKYVFNYLLFDEKALSPFDRAVYANAYDSRDGIRAGNGWYKTFPQDIVDYKDYSKLQMPVLAIGGPGYNWLQYVLPAKTTNLKVVKAEGSGHFIAEEKPQVVIDYITEFLD
ncbi:alpha/beta fold hydrolase [Flavobacterium sp. P21]|uniref:alpha/beta fold hydrolase n=1 Tax=Flavobacterium sp. P21 TaxID=3423948 RepID=UPI003D667CFC